MKIKKKTRGNVGKGGRWGGGENEIHSRIKKREKTKNGNNKKKKSCKMNKKIFMYELKLHKIVDMIEVCLEITTVHWLSWEKSNGYI